MAKKKDPKKTLTADELLAMPDEDRYEQTQRLLAERIAYHERKLAEEQASGGEPAGR